MKKKMLLLCATLLVFAGCAEDDSLRNGNDGLGTITAGIEQKLADSRVQINENNGGATLSWVEGDAFNTFGDITASYEYTGTAFEVEGNLPATINYAAYPKSYNPTLNATTLSMTWPESFDNVESQSKVPMWASAPSGNHLSFKHLATLLKIDLTGIKDYSQIVVTADKAIAGTFTADLSLESPVLSSQSENEVDKTVTIDLSNVTDDAEVVYLPIPATTYGSLKVTAKSDDTNVGDKDLKSWTNLTFERAKMYTASIVNLSTPEGVSEALENLGTAPVVLNLSAGFTTTNGETNEAASIIVPNVEGSDLTLNFSTAPTTSETKPLVIESEDETEVGESTKNITISIPETSGNNTYLEVNTPTTTATVTSGNYATLTATTATNTLIVKEGVTIDELIVNGGNVVIEKGATITDIENNGGGTIEYISVVIENTELSDALSKLYGNTYDIEINADGYAEMRKSEVLSITALDLQNYYFQYEGSIKTLEGIEHFVNLTHLVCGMIPLEECDLSKNIHLQYFSSSWSELTSLDLSNNPELTQVSLQNCQSLASLDLTGCTNLMQLEVNGTALTSLEIPNKEGMRSLLLGSSLDLSLDGFTNLKSLGLDNRGLTDLSLIPTNLKGQLTALYLSDNSFAILDLSGFSSLSHLECRNCQITELSNFTSLRSIYCDGNKIEMLDVTACENLNELICGNQQENIQIVLKLTAEQKTKLIDNAYYPELTDPETNRITLDIVE